MSASFSEGSVASVISNEGNMTRVSVSPSEGCMAFFVCVLELQLLLKLAAA